MRDARQVVQALEARLGRPLTTPSAEALLDRLGPLSQTFPALSAQAFGEAIASRLKSAAKREADLAALHLGDLLLALACLAHEPTALAQLDERLPLVVRTVARSASPSDLDELEQQLRIRLLVGEGRTPGKLALYGGRGALLGFMRVVALNLLNNTRARARPASDSGLGELPDGADWESRVLRVEQQAHFREAFRQAVRTLTARQRALLRLNLLDGLSIDELSPLYGAHRSSVSRWLAEARASLDAQTRKLLMQLLGMTEDEVEALLRTTQSGFELSLGRALRESLPNAP
jgi:RNA polymerase sigma-70 factor (ECF subfamily)